MQTTSSSTARLLLTLCFIRVCTVLEFFQSGFILGALKFFSGTDGACWERQNKTLVEGEADLCGVQDAEYPWSS